MYDAQLKRLEAEKKKLQDEAQFSTGIMAVSDAASDLVKMINGQNDPFVDSEMTNPYTKKSSDGRCSVL